MKKCFIITPIGNENEPIRRHIDGIIQAAIKPVLNNEYEVIIAHEMNKIGSITKQVIEAIYHSDLVIANLTNKNPNVMYELAFRHCLGKPVIQIMEEGTILPFDIGTERTIPYVNDSKGVMELREKLKEYLKEIDYENARQGPIYDVLKGISYEDMILKAIDNDPNLSYDKDIIKFLSMKFDDLDDMIRTLRPYDNFRILASDDVVTGSIYLRILDFNELNEEEKKNLMDDLFADVFSGLDVQKAYYDNDGIEFIIEKMNLRINTIIPVINTVFKKNNMVLDSIQKRKSNNRRNGYYYFKTKD